MFSIINIKTPKDLKLAAQETARELGVPLSTAINAFLKQFVRDREITFSASNKPSPYLLKVIEEAEADLVAGESQGPFSSADDMIASLES